MMKLTEQWKLNRNPTAKDKPRKENLAVFSATTHSSNSLVLKMAGLLGTQFEPTNQLTSNHNTDEKPSTRNTEIEKQRILNRELKEHNTGEQSRTHKNLAAEDQEQIDDTWRTSWICFVQFVDPYDASEAQYHMNGQIFAGREISVVLAAESRKRPEEMRQKSRRGPSGYGGRRSTVSYEWTNFCWKEISVVLAAESRKRPEEMRQKSRRGPSGYGGRRSAYHVCCLVREKW
ncbi:hypothetical protein K1719_017650 [Acacia pycnantha]|nr:hypothetical protein K1719_017650 [Acacia pycnantha]